MTGAKLPKESNSQRIGRYAVKAFENLCPIDWPTTKIDGDSDVGFDMQIQVVNKGKHEGIFRAQIKGCERKKQDGSNQRLSANGKFFSQELKITTLNFYLIAGDPVMLIFVDLTVDPSPGKCKVYYLWLNDELNNLLDGHDSLNHLEKKTHTFRIPVVNVLDNILDVLPYLSKQKEKRIALESFHKIIGGEGKEPTTTVIQLGRKFASSPAALDSVLTDTDSPWPEAPTDSVAGKLHAVSNCLADNNADSAKFKLDEIEKQIKKANNHEKAEYDFQKARLYALIGNHSEALHLFEEAYVKAPEIRKYHLGLIAEKLVYSYNDENLVKQVLGEINDRSGPEYARLKVKLHAILHDFDSAIDILNQEDNQDVFVVRAVVFFLQEDYEHCARYCEEYLLQDGIKSRQRLSLLIFRAHSLFNLGAKNSIDHYSGEVISLSELPDLDVKYLRKSWEDIQQGWVLAEQLGYPADVVSFLDISCNLSVYFNEENDFYPHLKHLAKIRPYVSYIQNTLLEYASNIEDMDVVLEQLDKLPNKSSTIVHRILCFYRLSRKNDVVQTANEHIKDIYKDKPNNLDVALAVAAECAHELLRTKERDQFLALLADLPNGKAMRAVYDFVSSIHNNVLNIPEAIEKLWNTYEEGEKDKQILTHLFDYLDITEDVGAERAIAVSADLVNQGQLTEKETARLCQALSQKEQWKDVVSTAAEALYRFSKSTRLKAVKAMGLDELGRTPEALKILEEAINESQYDSYAFEFYARLAARCG
ncbi:MAG: DUF4365 domain-containing protein, partial [Gammaproteobacteria bacterium]